MSNEAINAYKKLIVRTDLVVYCQKLVEENPLAKTDFKITIIKYLLAKQYYSLILVYTKALQSRRDNFEFY